jgi:predicted small integral membrane protein
MNLLHPIVRHPTALFFVCLFAVMASVSMTVWSFNRNLSDSRNATVEVCRSVNELRRQIYVAYADLGVPAVVRLRFLPTENCGDLP